jgi:hypothetical protein
MGGRKSCCCFWRFCLFLGEEDSRLCFCFFMLRKKWGGYVYGIYAMAASSRMQYDYKQTNCFSNGLTGTTNFPVAQ